jgi:hypothetical protein
MGRHPTQRTPAIATALCDWLAHGKSLVAFCDIDGNPDYSTIRRWLRDDADFRLMYTQAREDQAEFLADEITRIADDSTNDTQTDADGHVIVNHDHINRARLRVEARKWIAAKLKPRKYGERVELEHSGEINSSVTLTEAKRAELIELHQRARTGSIPRESATGGKS